LDAVDISRVRVRIKEDSTGAAPAAFGQFSVPIAYTSDSAQCRYTHPSAPPTTGQESFPLTLQAYDTQTGEALLECPIAVYHPPVLLIHGIWANSTSFETMENALNNVGGYPHALVSSSAADYRATNGRTYYTNRSVVPDAINLVLNNARAAGFAAAKVDVV